MPLGPVEVTLFRADLESYVLGAGEFPGCCDFYTEGLLLAVIEPQPEISPPPEATVDQKLVAAVLRKDRKATAELVSLYTDAVYFYVRRRLIPRADLVDDLVQEVFLAAWEEPTQLPRRLVVAELATGNRPA